MARFGPGEPPDGDGTPLSDAQPLTTGIPSNVTWIDPSSDFPPGRLDYLIYSDSVLEPRNGFVLYTPALTPEELNRYGLSATDTDASDHLPVVQDFVFPNLRVGSEGEGSRLGSFLSPPFPHPSSGEATLTYALSHSGHVSLRLFDLLGRPVRTLVSGYAAGGTYTAHINLSGLVAAVYMLRLETASGLHTRPLIVL